MKRVAVIFGTRPEIIKLAPVCFALRASQYCEPVIIATGQHSEMARQALNTFGLSPDYDLALMQPNQTSGEFLTRLLPALMDLFASVRPSTAVVQGDTTTALGGALAAQRRGIPVAHVEAGLRTHNLLSPFPEEINRVLISQIAALHFCPTKRAAENLAAENVEHGVSIVGNTVIDALKWVSGKLAARQLSPEPFVQDLGLEKKRFVLVTGHRRESFAAPLRNLCSALARLAEHFPDFEIVYPVHLNPNVKGPVHEILGQKKGIRLLPPVDYPSMVYLMERSSLIISDSGGIQEEAPAFGKYVLVTRNHTERQELVESGCGELVPLENADLLFETAGKYLSSLNGGRSSGGSPFGDGFAAERIAKTLDERVRATNGSGFGR